MTGLSSHLSACCWVPTLIQLILRPLGLGRPRSGGTCGFLVFLLIFYKTWILMRCSFEGFYFSATIWRTIDKGKIKILTLSSRGEINEPYLRRRRS